MSSKRKPTAQPQVVRLTAPDPVTAEELMPLARKLVGFAREQKRALDRGANEQFSWAGLRRDEVTDRLSRLLAGNVAVTDEQGAELAQLREQMLALDAAMEQRLRTTIEEANKRRGEFARTRRALSAYLTSGRR